MATILLGKDYTVSGTVSSVSELAMSIEGDSLDVTTRTGALPIKHTKAGLKATTFECTCLAAAGDSFSVGAGHTITTPEGTFAVIITNAKRGEPKDGLVTYQLTLKPGTESTNPVAV